jgi:hypothetical protein
VLAEPLGSDWVNPLGDLRLQCRLDPGLLSEGMLHAVDQLYVGADCSRDRQRGRDDRRSSFAPTMIRMAAPDATSSLARAS